MMTPADTPAMNTECPATNRAAEPTIHATPRAMPSFIAPAAPGMPDPVVAYHEDNLTVERVEYRNNEGELDRADGPAITAWYTNGVKHYEAWRRDGKIDRTNGPAITEWHDTGVKDYEQWWREDNLDRADGPAFTKWRANGVP